jgi:hypothetical protein
MQAHERQPKHPGRIKPTQLHRPFTLGTAQRSTAATVVSLSPDEPRLPQQPPELVLQLGDHLQRPVNVLQKSKARAHQPSFMPISGATGSCQVSVYWCMLVG